MPLKVKASGRPGFPLRKEAIWPLCRTTVCGPWPATSPRTASGVGAFLPSATERREIGLEGDIAVDEPKGTVVEKPGGVAQCSSGPQGTLRFEGKGESNRSVPGGGHAPDFMSVGVEIDQHLPNIPLGEPIQGVMEEGAIPQGGRMASGWHSSEAEGGSRSRRQAKPLCGAGEGIRRAGTEGWMERTWVESAKAGLPTAGNLVPAGHHPEARVAPHSFRTVYRRNRDGRLTRRRFFAVLLLEGGPE
jgi:hypothetical protein